MGKNAQQRRGENLPPNNEIRDTYKAQLPLIAAILSIGEEQVDFQQLAIDAVTLCQFIEMELEP